MHIDRNRFIAFILCSSITTDILFNIFGYELSLAKVLFFIFLGFVFQRGINLRKVYTYEVAIYIPILIYIVFSALLSNSFTDRSLMISTSLFICVFLLFAGLRSGISFDDISQAYLLTIKISLIVSVLQSITGHFFIVDRVFMSSIIPGFYRASGFMFDPNYYSLVCLIGVALSLMRNNKIMNLIICLSCILLSGSRSGLLLALIPIALFYYSSSKKINIRFIVVSLFIPFLFIFTAYIFKDYLPNTMTMLFDASAYTVSAERNSLNDRMMAITAALDAFYNNPWLGIGLGNLPYYPLNLFKQLSHNTIVEILAEGGLALLSVYAWFYFFLVSGLFKAQKKLTKDKNIYNSLFIAYILLFVVGLMSMTLVLYYSRILFFVFLLVLILIREVRSEYE